MSACDSAVAAWTETLGGAELEACLETAKVPAARIYTMADIFADPHYKARQMLVDVSDDVLGDVTVAGVVPKLSNTPGHIRWVGRDKGADTRDVLEQDLQLSAAEVDALVDAGVVAVAAASDADEEP